MIRRQGLRLSAAGWFVAAFAILTAVQLSEQSVVIPVVELPHSAVFSQSELWDVPAARLIEDSNRLLWPAWAVNALVASLIAIHGLGLTRAGLPWLAGVAVVILSLYAAPDQVLLAGLLTLLLRSATRHRLSVLPARWLGGMVLAVLCAIALTIDFGFVLLVVAVAVPVEVVRAVRERRHAAVALTTVMLAALVTALVSDGAFSRAALRPLLSLGLASAAPVCSELASPLTQPAYWPAVAVMLAVIWMQFAASRRHGVSHSCMWAIMLPFAVVGLLSVYCLWPSLVVLAALLWVHHTPESQSVHSLDAPPPTAQLVTIAVSIGMLGWIGRDHGSEYWRGSVASRVVDCSRWETVGRVLLTNLDHADDWKGERSPGSVRILMDGRWDASEFPADRYTSTCLEFLNGRRDSYTRSDGRLSGYHQAFTEWQPSVVVVDTGRLSAIRQLSVDPAWSVLAIDGRRVIFGQAEEPTNRRQADRAAALMSFLAWPNPRQTVELEGVLELGTRLDSRRIAAALNAMRLPYAALRVLPDDQNLSTLYLRAWSYLELSIRSIRQTGRRSLIDQFRAAMLFEAVESAPLSDMRVGGFDVVDPSVLVRQPTDTEAAADAAADLTAAEQSLRTAIANGDVSGAFQALDDIEGDAMREYYRAVISLKDQELSATTAWLEQVVLKEELDKRLQAEGCYYLGCLYLEKGQVSDAVRNLLRSRALRPASHHQSLRALYLNRLGAPENESDLK